MQTIRFIGAEQLSSALPPQAAVEAIRAALLGDIDPSRGHERTVVPLETSGRYLSLMPAETFDAVGLKVLAVAPDNPRRGLPRLHGIYLHFDPITLQLIAAIDGAALTTIRTPAVSVAALRDALMSFAEPAHLVIFGAGPQGRSHHKTIADIGVPLQTVTYIDRDPARADASSDDRVRTATVDEASRYAAEADIIVCATTARDPLFDSRQLKPTAVVIAVGSHEPEARELDGALLGRSQVIVEDVDTALRECGDVILAAREGHLALRDLHTVQQVVRGDVALDRSNPIVFKSCGMPWEDVVIAEAAIRSLHLR